MKRCVDPFAVFLNGQPHVYSGGQEVLDNDPILKTHAAHFEDAEATVRRRRRGIEQATAAPGEQRRLSAGPRGRRKGSDPAPPPPVPPAVAPPALPPALDENK